jgi:exodeoxyribonuclease-5
MDLTGEQRQAFDGILKGLSRGRMVQTIGGYAGTGKTTLITALAERLPCFAVCAFTGKAAYVLRCKGVKKAKTYHSLIYTPQEVVKVLEVIGPNGKTRQEIKRRIVWQLREKLDDDIEGIIIDEASMVAGRHYQDLVSFGLPLIFVGDHGQLEPVGDDPEIMMAPDFTLETIHRNAGEIAYFGEHLRRGNWASAWRLKPGAGQRVKLFQPSELIDRVRETEQTIVAFNSTRVAVNRHYRADVMGETGNTPVAGDRLIVLRNTRRLGVFNGQQVAVDSLVSDTFIRLKTEEGHLLAADNTREAFNNPKPEIDTRPEAPVPLDFAYAITAHKAQGSEWRTGAVVETYCPYWDHARWTYTAATRFKNCVHWTCSQWK